MDKSLTQARGVVLTQQNNEAKIALAAMPKKEEQEQEQPMKVPFE